MFPTAVFTGNQLELMKRKSLRGGDFEGATFCGARIHETPRFFILAFVALKSPSPFMLKYLVG